MPPAAASRSASENITSSASSVSLPATVQPRPASSAGARLPLVGQLRRHRVPVGVVGRVQLDAVVGLLGPHAGDERPRRGTPSAAGPAPGGGSTSASSALTVPSRAFTGRPSPSVIVSAARRRSGRGARACRRSAAGRARAPEYGRAAPEGCPPPATAAIRVPVAPARPRAGIGQGASAPPLAAAVGRLAAAAGAGGAGATPPDGLGTGGGGSRRRRRRGLPGAGLPAVVGLLLDRGAGAHVEVSPGAHEAEPPGQSGAAEDGCGCGAEHARGEDPRRGAAAQHLDARGRHP